MKKVYLLFISLFLILTLNITVSATELTYNNPITDDSTIVDDFKVLGLEISDYYIPEAYDYYKFYVVGVGESCEDNIFQTYFYLYNPTILNAVPQLSITYNGSRTCDLNIVEYDETHGLIKAVGFSYPYIADYVIQVWNIKSVSYEIDEGSVESDPIPERVERNSKSNFIAELKHNATDGSINIELKFNTLIILEEYEAFRVVVRQDDNFINNWNKWWSDSETVMSVYFYNFNFPERFKNTDIVRSAVFSYTEVKYKYVYKKDNISIINPTYSELVSSSEEATIIEQEYLPDTYVLRVNNYSQQLTFPTFYLGNRILDNQFGNLKMSEYSSDFNYDCSVLVGSSFESIQTKSDFKTINGINLKQIEMLELHFRCDGIEYKAQVVSTPVDPTPIIPDKPSAKKNLWEMFVDWFLSNLPYSVILIILIFVVLAVVIPVIIVLAPYIIKFIIWLFKIIIRIIILPFKLIASLFSKKRL